MAHRKSALSYKEANELIKKLVPWIRKNYTVRGSSCETEEFRSYGCIECAAFRTIDFLKEAIVLNRLMEKDDAAMAAAKECAKSRKRKGNVPCPSCGGNYKKDGRYIAHSGLCMFSPGRQVTTK